MDWNTLLLWMAAPSCVITLGAALRSSPKLMGWIFISLLIMASGGVAYILSPQNAGYIVGIMWAVLLVAPALLQRSSDRYSLRQQYDRAVSFAAIAGVLHPFDGMRGQPKLLSAISMAERGEIDAAINTLDHLERTAHLRIARSAGIHARRLRGDWPGVIDWIRQNSAPVNLLREPKLLPTYVRALGETGQLSEMLHATWASKLSHHPQLAAFRALCRMYCFVFCGRPTPVVDLFSNTLFLIPEHVQRFWIATAMYTAGLLPQATAEMDALNALGSPAIRLAIQRRRENPLAVASSLLTDADVALLDQIDLQQEHERRFSAAQGRGKRPLVTYALILANLAVFAVELFMGGAGGNWDKPVNKLGAMDSHVLQTHEYYRVFMANFLHYGYAHIVMNMLALYLIAPFVEFSLGWLSYLALYLISGVGVMGTVLYLQLHGWMDPNEYLVGASGAIMAVIGATAAILLRGWYRERAAPAMRRLQMVGFILVLQVTFDHFTPEVSGMAHILGMVWGFVLASVLPHRNRPGSVRGFEVLPAAATQKPSS